MKESGKLSRIKVVEMCHLSYILINVEKRKSGSIKTCLL
jgi:hypothetical protein